MIRKSNTRNITKFKRSVKAISPIIATLLLIAIVVVAALVAYAWVSGYIGSTTTNVGHEIQIPSFTSASLTGQPTNLTIYVQNTGQGVAQLKQDSAVYVNDTLYPILAYTDAGGVIHENLVQGSLITIGEGQTFALTVQPANYHEGDYVRIKVVMVGGDQCKPLAQPTKAVLLEFNMRLWLLRVLMVLFLLVVRLTMLLALLRASRLLLTMVTTLQAY